MRTTLASAALLVLLAAACGDDSATDASTSSGTGSGSGGSGSGGDGPGPTSSPASVSASTSGAVTSATTSTGTGDTSSGSGGGTTTSSGTGTGGGSAGCRQPGPADRDRVVLVGHPFGDGDYDNLWEVLRLTADGVLEQTGVEFEMGVAEDEPIAFTPDGAIALAPQRDGSLGIVRFDDAGTPTVIDAAFGLDQFYAGQVVVAPGGEYAIVADTNWPKNGGGLYRVDLDCETGEPTLVGQVIESKNAWALLSLGPDRWAVAGRGIGGVEDDTDVFDVRAGDPWTRAGGTDAFEYQDALPRGFAAARDGSFLLVSDFSEFSGIVNNVRFVAVDDAGFSATGARVEVFDPYAIAISPGGDMAFVASGFGDAYFLLDVDAGAADPLSLRGEVVVEGGPALPGVLASVNRGALDGAVLVEENGGVRLMQFVEGDIEDRGLLDLSDVPEDLTAIPIGIGVQP